MCKTKRYGQFRHLAAIVLLLALLPFSFVKATHHHEITDNTSQSAEHSSHGEDCMICNFTLSNFIETEEVSVSPVYTYFYNINFFYQLEEVVNNSITPSQRGPPSLA